MRNLVMASIGSVFVSMATYCAAAQLPCAEPERYLKFTSAPSDIYKIDIVENSKGTLDAFFEMSPIVATAMFSLATLVREERDEVVLVVPLRLNQHFPYDEGMVTTYTLNVPKSDVNLYKFVFSYIKTGECTEQISYSVNFSDHYKPKKNNTQ